MTDRNSPWKIYTPYLPAAVTLTGAVMLALGILVGSLAAQHQIVSNWLRFMGALVAAVGAFWAAKRQVTSSAKNAARDEKLLELSEELRALSSGGDSFCYGYPMSINPPGHFIWNFIHQGKFPLMDVSVRIYDFREPMARADRTFQLGTLFPGRAHMVNFPGADYTKTSGQAFNLFFLSRNGGWTQAIRWVELPSGELAVANRVVRDGASLNEPAYQQISPKYTAPTPADADWPAPPELVKL